MTKTPHHLYLSLGIFVALILAAGVGVALYDLTLIERNVNQSTLLFNQAITGTHKNGDDGLLFLAKNNLQNSAAALNALKQTLQDTNKIAKAQESRSNSLADASIAAVQSANVTIAKLGGAADSLKGVIGEVHDKTIPELDGGIDALNVLVTDMRPTAAALTGLATAATGDIEAFHKTIDLANTDFANPDIAATIHSFSLMAGYGVTTMQHVSGISSNADLTIGDVHTYIHNVTNPKKLTFLQTLAVGMAEHLLPAAAPALIGHFLGPSVSIVGTVPVTVTPTPANPNKDIRQ